MKIYDIIFESSHEENLLKSLEKNAYIAIKLSDDSHEQLLNFDEVKHKIAEGWKPLAHHVSLIPPPSTGGFKRLLQNIEFEPRDQKGGWIGSIEQWQDFKNRILELLNKEVSFVATEIGISDNALAVKVQVPEFESFMPLNNFLHVTIATPTGGGAQKSKDINNFEPVKDPVSLTGIVSVIG
jgi:hypothetical protein